MLAVRDPDVQELLDWFHRCYTVEVDSMSGRAWWKQTALPREGGIAEQDARLMNGLAFVAHLQQQVLDEEIKRQRKAAADERG